MNAVVHILLEDSRGIFVSLDSLLGHISIGNVTGLLQMFAKVQIQQHCIFGAGDGPLRLRAPAADRRPHRLPRSRVPLLVSGTRNQSDGRNMDTSSLQSPQCSYAAPLLTSARGEEVKGVADGRAAGCLN